jgi:uncharacterized protein DUF6682
LALLVSDILTRAGLVLNDPSNVRWAQAELIAWINDGMRDIATFQPEATAKIANVTLAAGTKQVLPTGAIKLIRVIRNMGVGGATPAEAPRPIDQKLLNLHKPTWQADTPTLLVKNYMRDDTTPRIFYVWPPMSGATTVECEYSVIPATVAAGTDSLTIDDFYANPLLDYVLWRAFSKDVEVPSAKPKADAHRASYERAINLTAVGEAQVA